MEERTEIQSEKDKCKWLIKYEKNTALLLCKEMQIKIN